jgi:hypothetical protein
MGFTPSNDAKQTLNAGEMDDDYLNGNCIKVEKLLAA